MELLRITNATLKTDRVLATNVSLTVRSGNRVVIVGPNGCGKTTLLHAIRQARQGYNKAFAFAPGTTVGLMQQDTPPPTGAVGREVARLLRPLKQAERRVAQLAARTSSGEASLREYQAALDEFESLGGFTAEERFWRLLADIEIEPSTDFEQLSAEQWQLFQIAEHLAMPSSVLLLDEPTTHLGSYWAERATYWLRRYNGALIVTSHDRVFIRALHASVHELTPLGLTPFQIPSPRATRSARSDWEKKPIVHHEKQNVSLIIREGDRIALGSANDPLFSELAGRAGTGATVRTKHALTLREVGSPAPATTVLTYLQTGSVAGSAEQQLTELGLPPHRWNVPVAHLSGGEQRRVQLARALLDEADVILWPNASAALDLPGMIATERVLMRYTEEHNAALVFSAADREFRANVANRRWPEVRYEHHPEPLGFAEAPLVSPEEEAEEALARTETLLANRAELRERVVKRLLAERAELSGEVMERYNRMFPAPRARFRVLEHGTEYFADTQPNAAQSWVSHNSRGQNPLATLHHFGTVGHIQLMSSADSGAINALVHYAFLYAGLEAVQLQHDAELQGVLLKQNGNWWRLTKTQYEQIGGWHARAD